MGSERLGDDELAAIAARAEAATAGPWRAGNVEAEGKVWAPYAGALEGPHGERCLLNMNTHFPHATDRVFIAAARTDVPALLAEIRRLRADAPALLEARAEATSHFRELLDATKREFRAEAERDALAAEVARLRGALERAIAASRHWHAPMLTDALRAALRGGQ